VSYAINLINHLQTACRDLCYLGKNFQSLETEYLEYQKSSRPPLTLSLWRLDLQRDFYPISLSYYRLSSNDLRIRLTQNLVDLGSAIHNSCNNLCLLVIKLQHPTILAEVYHACQVVQVLILAHVTNRIY
jgi:hypothetical protein